MSSSESESHTPSLVLPPRPLLLLPDVSLEDVLEEESTFTLHLIGRNLSNYSAFHHRSKLLPLMLLLMRGRESNADAGAEAEAEADSSSPSPPPSSSSSSSSREDASDAARLSLASSELSRLSAALFTDPDDQSPWWYHRFLVSYGKPKCFVFPTTNVADADTATAATTTTSTTPAPDDDVTGTSPRTLAKTLSPALRAYAELLDREATSLRSLLEEEGGGGVGAVVEQEDAALGGGGGGGGGGGASKWILCALLDVLLRLDALVGDLSSDAESVRTVLKNIDPDKRGRYDDMRKQQHQH